MCENMIWGHAPPTKKAKETSRSPTAETLDRSQDMDRTHVITNPITVIGLLFINNSFPLLNNCFINSYNKKTTCKNTNNKLIHHRITWGLLVLSNSTWFNDLIWCDMIYIYATWSRLELWKEEFHWPFERYWGRPLMPYSLKN